MTHSACPDTLFALTGLKSHFIPRFHGMQVWSAVQWSIIVVYKYPGTCIWMQIRIYPLVKFQLSLVQA